MKTIKPFFSILLLITSTILSSYHPQNWSSWSEWQQSDCYEGIWTRHRSQPSSIQGKQKVQVEVRNSYRHGISIKTRLTNDRSELPTYRFDIPAGQTYSSSATEAFLLSGQRFYFRINEVRFAGDKYGDPYRECDRSR